MKARVLITTLVSFLLLCAVVAAGLNAVFTVTSVKAEFSVASAEGEREAARLKEQLDGLVGKSSAFLDEDDVRAIVSSYPCMKAEKIEKHYPSTLEVTISERKEVFSVLTDRGYGVISDDGTFLYYKNDLTNRSGGENILLEGFDFSDAPEEAGGNEYLGMLLSMYGVFTEVLTEPRANVLSVTYNPGAAFDSVVIRMREGVRIEIVSPREMTEEKARAALLDEGEGYLSRTDGERLCGCITVVGGEGVTAVDYDAERN